MDTKHLRGSNVVSMDKFLIMLGQNMPSHLVLVQTKGILRWPHNILCPKNNKIVFHIDILQILQAVSTLIFPCLTTTWLQNAIRSSKRGCLGNSSSSSSSSNNNDNNNSIIIISSI